MKHKFILLPILGMLLAGCGGGVAVTGVTVTAAGSVSVLNIEDTVQMSATVLPSNAIQTVTWSVSDSAVASISTSGLVKGLTAGDVTVTATSTYDTTKKGTYNLAVSAPLLYDTINSVLTEKAPGDVVSVKGQVVALTTKSFVVSDNTGSILVHLNTEPTQSVGDVVIVSGTLPTKYSTQNQFDSSCTIVASTGVTFTGTPAQWTATEFDAYNAGTALLTPYVKMDITLVTASYSNFSVEGSTVVGAFQYPLADFEITAENDGRSGEVEGFMVGTRSGRNNLVVTSMTFEEQPDPVSVEISGASSVAVAKSIQLSAAVLPADADQAVVWSSSVPTVATISATGLVSGVAVGTTTITAKCEANESIIDTLDVTVTAAPVVQYELLAKYDFTASGHTLTGTELTAETAKTLFVDSFVTGGTDKISSIGADTTGAYDGNGTGGAYPNTAALIKFGTGKKNGSITINFEVSTNVAKVVINCHDWNKKSEQYPTNSNSIAVNGDSQLFPYNETGTPADLSFEIAETDSVAITTSNTTAYGRGFAFSMEFYTVAA